MTNARSHFALREWRRQFSKPITFYALAGVTIVLTISGPFDTASVMRFLPRLGYWAFVTFGGYSIGFLLSRTIIGPETPSDMSITQTVQLACIVAAALTLFIFGLNYAVFGPWVTAETFIPTALSMFAISAVVTATITHVSLHFAQSDEPDLPEVSRGIPILDRIELEKRAPLVAISVEDHYVRIRTEKGETVVLMRLSDAIREVGDTDGLQVHRSHWVVKGAVTRAQRKGDRAILTMTHGADIPVSRSYIPTIKEAGLLPA